MKKKICLILTLIVFVVFTGCTIHDEKLETTPPSTIVPGSQITDKDLTVNINGTDISINDDVQKLINILGDDYEYQEAISCAYDGFDKTYDYGDIFVLTVPPAGTDVISELQVRGGDYTTQRGIKIGDSFDTVKAAYGDNYTLEGDILSYWKGEESPKTPKIYFQIDDDKVVYFSIFAANNIK